MIYADNAATTKLDKGALESMLPYMEECFGNPSQPYTFSKKVRKGLREAREIIAHCIGALPEEIYFTSGGTESDNWAIKGIARNSRGKVLTSQIEHHAVLNSCKMLECEGHKVEYLPVNSEGIVRPEVLENNISEKCGLVSIMFANNEIGTIEPIQDLVRISHTYGTLFHTDAVQAVGHVPIDVSTLGVDLLSASGHKFNGPKGVGFLFVRKGVEILPFMDGGTQEASMRAGTESVAAIIGMARALEDNCYKINENQQHIMKLENELLARLSSGNVDYIRNGASLHLPGNISLSFRDYKGEMLLHRLDLMGIMISTGSACDSKNVQISHVLRAINIPREYAVGTIRISLSKENTLDEIVCIAEAIKKIVGK